MDIYTVDYSGTAPKCECLEWLHTEMPCKHVFALLQQNNILWNDLAEEFR